MKYAIILAALLLAGCDNAIPKYVCGADGNLYQVVEGNSAAEAVYSDWSGHVQQRCIQVTEKAASK